MANKVRYISNEGKENQRIHYVDLFDGVPQNPTVIYSNKESVPNQLRKYYKVNENSFKVLTEGNIWAAHPFSFNDPFDCALQLWNNATFPLKEAKSFLNEFLPSGFPIDADLLKTRKSFFELVLRFIGIYCLNEHKNDELTLSDYEDLLWGYYTEHQGFSIVFESKSLTESFKLNPIKIEYQAIKEKDKLDLIPTDLVDYKFFPKTLRWTTIKKEEWKDENEWRYVFTNIDFGNTNRLKKFQFQAIQQIILGYKFFPNIDYERINDWTTKYIFKDDFENNYSYKILKFLYDNTHILLKQVSLTENFHLFNQRIFIKEIIDNHVIIVRK